MRQGVQSVGRRVDMLKADLHSHSTFSDGSDTVEQLVAAAENKRLDILAITDHDTLSHLAAISQIDRNTALKVIGGVEISACDPQTGVRAHILGYNIKNPAPVLALTQPLLERRNLNSERQAEILRRHGYELDPRKLRRADGKYLYKQHIMDHLVATGQVNEMFGDFYHSTFKNHGICAFDIAYANVFPAVAAIKRAGGQAVLAHAGEQQNFYLIPALVRCGLDGLELNHPANTAADRERLRQYAEEYDLFLTGGSDDHGRYGPRSCGVGDYLAEESGVDAICSE